MKRKPKPPTSAWWCPSCGRVSENCYRHKNCGAMDCDGTHGTTLVRVDIVPRGGARVVRMAKRWHRYRNTTNFHTESEYATDTLLAEDIREAVFAMESKGAKR